MQYSNKHIHFNENKIIYFLFNLLLVYFVIMYFLLLIFLYQYIECLEAHFQHMIKKKKLNSDFF